MIGKRRPFPAAFFLHDKRQHAAAPTFFSRFFWPRLRMSRGAHGVESPCYAFRASSKKQARKTPANAAFARPALNDVTFSARLVPAPHPAGDAAPCRSTPAAGCLSEYGFFPLPRTIPPRFLTGSLTPVSAGSSVPALRLLESRLTIFPLRGDALASFAPCPLRPVHSVPPRFIPDSPQFPRPAHPSLAADRG